MWWFHATRVASFWPVSMETCHYSDFLRLSVFHRKFALSNDIWQGWKLPLVGWSVTSQMSCGPVEIPMDWSVGPVNFTRSIWRATVTFSVGWPVNVNFFCNTPPLCSLWLLCYRRWRGSNIDATADVHKLFLLQANEIYSLAHNYHEGRLVSWCVKPRQPQRITLGL